MLLVFSLENKVMRKAAAKKKATPAKKNKLGVKNSLVNNINAKKKKGTSKTKKEIYRYRKSLTKKWKRIGIRINDST
jgi:hypothetical protein